MLCSNPNITAKLFFMGTFQVYYTENLKIWHKVQKQSLLKHTTEEKKNEPVEDHFKEI